MSVNLLSVYLDFGDIRHKVGRLAYRERRIFFEYDTDFLRLKINISPFKLPFKEGLMSFEPFLFEGLPGVFNDSLPDGWGRLLLDRSVRTRGLGPSALTPLDRLAHVGINGIGALAYEPDTGADADSGAVDLDSIFADVNSVIEGDSGDILAELIALNGSSAGARPKALIGVDISKTRLIHGAGNVSDEYEQWIVKFPNSSEGKDAGAVEYVYSLMAKDAGIEMCETHLFPSEQAGGFFAIKRFDRSGSRRLHVHSACGLLHSDFRVPSLDYIDLMKAAFTLTRDVREVAKVYRLAVFNVFSHNRDDHSKNFSFLMDKNGLWCFAPAYDLTFSSGPNGEQSSMVDGEGRNPMIGDLLRLAEKSGIKKKHAQEIIEQVLSSLGKWNELARGCGVSRERILTIDSAMQRLKK